METALGEIWDRAASRELEQIFLTIWQNISPDRQIQPIEGMPNRLQAIIDANDCSTPY
jgi:hypothetical protein